MSFNTEANLVYAENPAMTIGKGPIPLDNSSLQEVMYQYHTTTAPVVGGVGEPNNFNGVETLFDINISANNRVLFDKSYLRINGFACDMLGGVNTGVTQLTSIPWNSIAALLATAEVKLNQSAITTEQITQNLGDGSMVKMLTRYSPDVLEGMSDEFFTPCLEETRDELSPPIPPPQPNEKNAKCTSSIPLPKQAKRSVIPAVKGAWTYPSSFVPATSYMSTTSQFRSYTQLTNATSVQPLVHAKNLYLCDIFDSLRIPSAFYTQNIQLKFRPKLTGDILFTDTNGQLNSPPVPLPVGYNPKYFVTGMTLFLCQVTLTEDQLRREAEKMKSNASMLRESFWAYDAVQKTHSQNASYRDSNIKNMQAAVFMFPSRSAADGLGINPYQYTYGCSTGGVTTGVTSYQHKYDSKNSPNNYLAVTPAIPSQNTDLFAQYRLLCRRMSDRETPVALNFLYHYGGINVGLDLTDHSNYVLFCAQFYPLTSYGHSLMMGSDHEIITAGGATEPIVIVRIRLSFMEIRGDTQVYMIN